jgi:hypothetical protein
MTKNFTNDIFYRTLQNKLEHIQKISGSILQIMLNMSPEDDA